VIETGGGDVLAVRTPGEVVDVRGPRGNRRSWSMNERFTVPRLAVLAARFCLSEEDFFTGQRNDGESEGKVG
jgi:hypothetical protein